MKRVFVSLTVAGLVAILVPVSAHASNLAFDAAGNLFWADGPSVFKCTPDGAKSTFAAGLKGPLSLCFDSKGDFFVDRFSETNLKPARFPTRSPLSVGDLVLRA
jgi:hypothetical protein